MLTGRKFGYVRISTKKQNEARQHNGKNVCAECIKKLSNHT